MAKINAMDILYTKERSPLEFNFESLVAPPISSFLTVYDIQRLNYIATSIKLSGKMSKKLKMIDEIMKARGCKKLASGTNRIVYTPLENQSVVLKIALDRVGLRDTPDEYKNQFLLKPFVTKVFEHTPCGTVGLVERVEPIIFRKEFESIAVDIFDLLINNIIGEYVLEDIGTKYFMNWAVRKGFGPVLLDFPYVYRLDGRKLICNKVDMDTGIPCGGEIDYDNGFNNLICNKCSKLYHAKDLQDDSNKGILKIQKEGDGYNMKIEILQGDQVVRSVDQGSETIEKPKNNQVRTRKNEDLIRATDSEIGTVVIVDRPIRGKKRFKDPNKKYEKFAAPKTESVEPEVKEVVLDLGHNTPDTVVEETGEPIIQAVIDSNESTKEENETVYRTMDVVVDGPVEEEVATEEEIPVDIDPDEIAKAMVADFGGEDEDVPEEIQETVSDIIDDIDNSEEDEEPPVEDKVEFVEFEEEVTDEEESDPNISQPSDDLLAKFNISESDFDEEDSEVEEPEAGTRINKRPTPGGE